MIMGFVQTLNKVILAMWFNMKNQTCGSTNLQKIAIKYKLHVGTTLEKWTAKSLWIGNLPLLAKFGTHTCSYIYDLTTCR